MKKFDVVRHDLYDREEQMRFTDRLTERTAEGYNIESCGIGGDTCRMGWAILSKPAEEKKTYDLIEAAKMIAERCLTTDDCLTCPLCRFEHCLASGGRGSGVPSGWTLAKEL